ncbi:MAG: hypothetical protein ACE5FS_14850 [Paracoccaceae bacterium]
MPMTFEKPVHGLRDVEGRLENRIGRQSTALRSRLSGVFFDAGIRRGGRQYRTRLASYIRGARPMVVLTAPVIYAMIVPLVVMDVFVSVYQAVCFPVYGIEKVRRRDYLVFDRHQLGYLNALEKLNCAYCAYANGLIAYAREIAARTEQYWCPIKHARRAEGTHERYADFADFGDAAKYREEIAKSRSGPGEKATD